MTKDGAVFRLPEVRQDCRPGSNTFGATATELINSPLADYGVMTTDRGGSFASAEQVKDWTVLVNPGFAIEAS